ncbi:MAG: roadblock/LC7 domain-containing protein [Acidobacteria bacterium]|nr:roadblock/LC7 domain-containing protein [Acidobacteriota bacterium]
MAGFAEALRSVAAKVPETQVLMVMGTDGIPIERLVVRADPNLEAVAAEYTTLLRASLAAASDTGLGDLQELSVVTEKMIALLVAITPEYFLFAALSPGAMTGRARFALRRASLSLEGEFQ